MLRRNFRYKLLALAVAIIIWAYANEGQNPSITREMKVALDVRNVQMDCVIADSPRMVKITLEGQRSLVESIIAEPDTIAAYVNCRGKDAGRYILPVKAEIPIGLKGLVHAIPVPREISVNLDEKSQRTLPIDVQFVSPPPVGYRFGSPELSPGKAMITGTARQVSAVSQLVAEAELRSVNDGGIDGDFALVAQDKNGNPIRGIEVAPQQAHLRLQLLEAPASRIVFVSPDIVGQISFPYRVTRIDVSPQTIAVTGRPEQLSNVTTLRTQPISIAEHTSPFTRRVRVITPKGLTIGDNRFVRVTVDISATPAQAATVKGQ